MSFFCGDNKRLGNTLRKTDYCNEVIIHSNLGSTSKSEQW